METCQSFKLVFTWFQVLPDMREILPSFTRFSYLLHKIVVYLDPALFDHLLFVVDRFRFLFLRLHLDNYVIF